MNFKQKLDRFFANSLNEFQVSLHESGTVSAPSPDNGVDSGIARVKKPIGTEETEETEETDELEDENG